ncbi:MAG: TonB-dependent receptor [Acidobacteria bacterium]|nr:TonB-dependent receptor [Acidobacteriota bacterium]MCA1637652.1 TonB-dependent receptor [Acidobacteriota bacterium]
MPEDPQGLSVALQALSAASGNSTGGDVNVDGFSGSRIPPKKAIREIRINKNIYSAEFNRPGNGRIEILTKPGAEEFHGGAYFEFNNNKFNTRNPFASTTTPYQSNYYSFNLGGPVLRNRLSFFFNFDKGKTDSNSLINARVMDSNLNIVPFSSTVSTPQRFTNFMPRFDLKLNNNNTLVGRYGFSKSSSDNAGVGGFSLLSRAYKTSGIEHALHLTETAVLNQRMVSETRFQFVNRHNRKQSNNFGGTVDVPGAFTGGGTSFDNISDRYNRSEISNVITISLNNHTIRTGGGFRYVNVIDSSTQGFGGSYRFDGSLAPQLDNNNRIVYGANGQPIIIPITGLERYWRTLMFSQLGFSNQDIRNLGGGATQFNITTGNPETRVSQRDIYAFVQDDWRLRPNFTLGLGLRYESQSNINGNGNFAPRVSFAWSKMGKANKSKGKNKGEKKIDFILRGGVGIFYERLGEDFALRTNRLNGINQRQYIVTDPSVLDIFPQVPSINTLAGLPNTSSVMRQASDLRVPYSIQSTISFEKQLPIGVVLSTTYLNTRTMNALRTRYINSPTSGIGQTDKIFQYESSGRYQQNQSSFTATKRLKNSSVYATYTLRKAKSDTDGADTLAQDSSNLKDEYGRASTDIRHNVYIGGWFRPFYNIDINPIIIYRSGIPYNITTGRDTNGDTYLTERPSFATDLNRPSVIVTSMGAFDLDPIPGQIIIPRNYGTSPSFFSVNTRVGKTFIFSKKSKSDNPFYLTLSVQIENLFNNINAYIPEGNLSSPLFRQFNSSAGAYGFGGYTPGNRIIKPNVVFNF